MGEKIKKRGVMFYIKLTFEVTKTIKHSLMTANITLFAQIVCELDKNSSRNLTYEKAS